MQKWNDADLLSAYANRQSEAAFGVLVERYVALVYSSALRQVQNPHLAEEVTQAAFIILAQKAQRLNGRVVLSGWLCRTAHFVARNALKAELRRQYREKAAEIQSLVNEPEPDVWRQLAPLLDEAVAQLNEADRNAVVLRFYEHKPLIEVGESLGIDPDAAQKRVSRALEKLRKYFARRGVALSVVAIAGAVTANSVQAAPVGLIKTVSAVAISKGATASISTSTFIKGALKLMTWTKGKNATMVGILAILVATSTSVIGFKLLQRHRQTSNSAAGLSPIMIDTVANIQPDGTVNFLGALEETNSTRHPISVDGIDVNARVSRITDQLGKPMKFSTLSEGRYLVAMVKPVPPGGKVSYRMEGTVADLIKTNGADEYEIGFTNNAGNVTDLHYVQVWRLPIGATLVGGNGGMQETTNDGRIELRVDKIVPSNGGFPVGFRYRLAANAN